MSPRLAWISAFLMAAGLALPIGYYEEDLVYWSQFPLSAVFVAFGIVAVVAGERWLRHLAKGELWAWLGPIAVLLAASAGIVVYAVLKGRRTRDLDDFLVADRRQHWHRVALSIMATQASAITFLATPG